MALRFQKWFLLMLPLAALAGCSDEPKEPPRAKVPANAAEEAMRLYDKNGDGKLDAEELKASPPLQELLLNLKFREPSHGDTLTAEDLNNRFKQWNESPTIVMSSVFTVTLDDKPVEGAGVTFVPEPFLGASCHTHTKPTNAMGVVVLDADLPDYPNEIYVGLYRVSVSKIVNGKETIPEKYATQATSILGREVATNIRESRSNVMIRLTSK